MKFCEKCGKELLDEAIICVGCGCPVENMGDIKQVKADYKKILSNTKVFLIIGFVLLLLGIFAWAATNSLALFYTVIAEEIHFLISSGLPPLSMYRNCDTIALYSSVAFFLAAELIFLVPKNKFNATFRRENQQILYKAGKIEYKKVAREKNNVMMKEVSGYKICWIMSIVSCVMFIISVFMPSLAGV